MSARYVLLALLSAGPKGGLQLREEFEAWTGEAWTLNAGQVDTALRWLERDGLVDSGDAGADGPQKGFRVTADGAAELAVWLRTPPDLASPPYDELATKILVAARVPGTNDIAARPRCGGRMDACPLVKLRRCESSRSRSGLMRR